MKKGRKRTKGGEWMRVSKWKELRKKTKHGVEGNAAIFVDAHVI